MTAAGGASRTILLTGASGYVGGRLLPLLEARGHLVRCLARRPEHLAPRVASGTTIVRGDLLDPSSLPPALEGVHTAYYLVHSMASPGSFETADFEAATHFGRAARAAGVRHIIYLGGLGRSEGLSSHLASRQEVGRVLRESGVPTTEFRASVIIGSGSLSFELVRALVEKLPAMTTPRWVAVPAQPISIEDALAYLVSALERDTGHSEIFEIGGADRVSYLEIMREYARQRGLHRVFLPVPVLTPRLSSLWLGLVTPVYARVGRALIDGVRNETVVTDDAALRAFPLRPRGIREAIERALAHEDRAFAATRWNDVFPAPSSAPRAAAVHGRRIVDSRAVRVACPPEDAFHPVERIGGQTGWYFADGLWKLRGWLDLLLGGAGLRRGRRDPEHLSPGDTVDFWRVQEIEPSRRLVLFAEMRLPGRAWLVFEAEPEDEGHSRLRQTAIFDPRGLAGLLYWHALLPVHALVFRGMLRRLRDAAELPARRRHRVLSSILAALLLAAPAAAADPAGLVEGRVFDALTREPLAGAAITVVGTPRGASAGLDGVFRLAGLAPGTYLLEARMLGYELLRKTDVVVAPGRQVEVVFALRPSPIALDSLMVRPRYFAEPSSLPVSTQDFSNEEIRRAPGGFGDVLSAISVLPGVVQPQSGRNDFLVRGGAPSENLYLVDGLEVPNINHFGTQGAAGGTLSFVNLDFVRDVSFSAGGFGARYGDRLSSVTQIELDDGRSDRLGGKATLSATQFGLNAEGPLGTSGSYLASARRSYLDLIFRAAGFSFVPEYWDMLSKVTLRLGARNEISFLTLGALDNVDFFNDSVDKRFDNSRVMGSSQDQYTSGFVWKRLLARGFASASLGRSYVRYRYEQADTLLHPIFSSDSREGTTSLQTDALVRIGDRGDLSIGARVVSTRAEGGLRLRSFETSFGDTLAQTDARWDASLRKAAGYANLSLPASARLRFALGVRLDYFAPLDRPFALGPRFSASYQLSERTSLALGGGIYRQSPSTIWLAANRANRALRHLRADQIVVGLDCRSRPDTRLRVEGYWKRYREYPASYARPYLVMANTGAGFGGSEEDFASFGFDRLTSGGSGLARGLEFTVQKRFSDLRCYGLASLSLSRTEFTGLDGSRRRGSHDQPVILNLSGGYKPGDRWEYSGRFRVGKGRPYTPFEPSGVRDPARWNSRRLPVFHGLDLRVDRRWNQRDWTMVAYLDLQNVYFNRRVGSYRWDKRDGREVAERNIGFLPSLGVSAEF